MARFRWSPVALCRVVAERSKSGIGVSSFLPAQESNCRAHRPALTRMPTLAVPARFRGEAQSTDTISLPTEFGFLAIKLSRA